MQPRAPAQLGSSSSAQQQQQQRPLSAGQPAATGPGRGARAGAGLGQPLPRPARGSSGLTPRQQVQASPRGVTEPAQPQLRPISAGISGFRRWATQSASQLLQGIVGSFRCAACWGAKGWMGCKGLGGAVCPSLFLACSLLHQNLLAPCTQCHLALHTCCPALKCTRGAQRATLLPTYPRIHPCAPPPPLLPLCLRGRRSRFTLGSADLEEQLQAAMRQEAWHRSDHYDEKVDIWQLGCLVHELLCGCLPFEVSAAPPGPCTLPGHGRASRRTRPSQLCCPRTSTGGHQCPPRGAESARAPLAPLL
jgi:hypothetical protein